MEKEKEFLEKLDRIEKHCILLSKSMLLLDDVSFLTGLSKSSLYKMTNGTIPCYKPTGGTLYFDKKEIEEWMKTNKQNTKFQ